MRIYTALVCFSSSILIWSHEAKAVDWCSATPRPNSARLIVNEAKLEPLNRNRVVLFYSKLRLPSRTWCYAHDDQQGGNYRQGQCFGIGSGDCLQGWIMRNTGEQTYRSAPGTIAPHMPALRIWFVAVNQHSNDTRFFTIYDDLSPADPKPEIHYRW
jgi:hypothetical protein